MVEVVVEDGGIGVLVGGVKGVAAVAVAEEESGVHHRHQHCALP